jgi:hypothetical protein
VENGFGGPFVRICACVFGINHVKRPRADISKKHLSRSFFNYLHSIWIQYMKSSLESTHFNKCASSLSRALAPYIFYKERKVGPKRESYAYFVSYAISLRDINFINITLLS